MNSVIKEFIIGDYIRVFSFIALFFFCSCETESKTQVFNDSSQLILLAESMVLQGEPAHAQESLRKIDLNQVPLVWQARVFLLKLQIAHPELFLESRPLPEDINQSLNHWITVLQAESPKEMMHWQLLGFFLTLQHERLDLADQAFSEAIIFAREQLQEMFTKRQTFDPKALAIHQLKQQVRYLEFKQAEVWLYQSKWDLCRDRFSSFLPHGNTDEAKAKLEDLKKRQDVLRPFLLTSESSNFITLYDLEWNRLKREVEILSQTLLYLEANKEFSCSTK